MLECYEVSRGKTLGKRIQQRMAQRTCMCTSTDESPFPLFCLLPSRDFFLLLTIAKSEFVLLILGQCKSKSPEGVTEGSIDKTLLQKLEKGREIFESVMRQSQPQMEHILCNVVSYKPVKTAAG
jgi:hypothetical protein